MKKIGGIEISYKYADKFSRFPVKMKVGSKDWVDIDPAITRLKNSLKSDAAISGLGGLNAPNGEELTNEQLTQADNPVSNNSFRKWSPSDDDALYQQQLQQMLDMYYSMLNQSWLDSEFGNVARCQKTCDDLGDAANFVCAAVGFFSGGFPGLACVGVTYAHVLACKYLCTR
jgi:hypothetical protein